MHAIMRSYSGKGAKELFDVFDKNKAEVERVMGPIKGFVSYLEARTADGGFSITVCEDKAGTEESTRAARDWIAKNAGNIGAAAPSVSEGTVMLYVKRANRTISGNFAMCSPRSVALQRARCSVEPSVSYRRPWMLTVQLVH